MRWIIPIILGLAVVLPTHHALSAEQAEVPTVVVLPLEVSSEGRYAYLNRVINQMFLTRLSQAPGLHVLGSALKPDEQQKIKSLLQSGNVQEVSGIFDADWFVDGTMHSLKEGLQINISLYPMNGDGPVNLTAKAAGENEIMGAVGALSQDIADTVVRKQVMAIQPEKTGGEGGLSGFETPHPEREYKKGLFGGTSLIGGGDGDQGFESRGVRRSDAIPIAIVSLASGDLNGDGVNDLVVASRSKIRVYNFNDLKFTSVAEYDFSPRMKINVINIGDHDGSGTMKLYVSANEGRFVSSAILRWNGTASLQPVRQMIPWYIRPLETPDGKTMLIGQQANDREEDGFLQPGVFQLSIDPQNSRIVKGDKLLLPEGTNVFDFIQADLDGDTLIETMVIDKKQKLLVYDAALNMIWVSSANYGGSKNYFGPSRELTNQMDTLRDLTEAQQDNRRLVWIPGRLDVKDITGDGLPEVVVSTNDIGVDKYFENSRFYEGGSVACLGWYGQGLAELWQTNHISGYVADYFFDETVPADDADSATVLNRLYVAQIPETTLAQKLLPGSDKSRILAYEMVVKKNGGATAQK